MRLVGASFCIVFYVPCTLFYNSFDIGRTPVSCSARFSQKLECFDCDAVHMSVTGANAPSIIALTQCYVKWLTNPRKVCCASSGATVSVQWRPRSQQEKKGTMPHCAVRSTWPVKRYQRPLRTPGDQAEHQPTTESACDCALSYGVQILQSRSQVRLAYEAMELLGLGHIGLPASASTCERAS